MKKRFFVLAFALVFAAGLAWAGGEHQKMDVAAHVAKLKAELNLTDQQTEKVRAVLQDIHQRKMAAKEKAGQDSAAFQQQHKKLMEERDARLREILTPEQFARYQKLTSEHGNEHAAPQKK
ncbi:MAG: hypothetical protein HY237_10410 [Acidobacteria bacterium]|nr:hypothetical protein [Acidobacteriota bacterium]